VLVGELGRLDVTHSTLVPSAGGLTVNSSSTPAGGHNAQLSVSLNSSITGPLQIPNTVKSLAIADSIIDGRVLVVGDEDADDGDGDVIDEAVSETIWAITGDPQLNEKFAPASTIERSTLFGKVYVKALSLASEVIFTQAVIAERMQVGCVRFSYVSPGTAAMASQVPRRFRCQPDLALAERAKEFTEPLDEEEIRRVEMWQRPVFSSLRYGDPDYAQLSGGCPRCPSGILSGAEDGSEMGVFSHLKQPQREANIRTNLNEYLRFGMDAGIFYIN